MVKRIALAIGSIAAAGVLALGIAAAGFGPAASVDAGQSDTTIVGAAAADSLVAEPVVQTETVYVRPAAAPKVIHVTKQAETVRRQTVRTQRPTQRVQESDDQGEGGDD